MTTRDDVWHQSDDDSPFTEEARAQVVLAYLARELADSAHYFVSATPRPEVGIVGDAFRLANTAESLLRYAVVVARAAGHSWERIGEELDITKQSAQKRFGDAVARFEKALAEPEAVNSFGNTYSTLPYGADDTAAIAARLDQWAVRHREPGRLVSRDHPDAPVSGGLRRMGPLEELQDISARTRRLLQDHIFPAEQLAPLYEREAVLSERLADAGIQPAANRQSAAKSRQMAARARARTSAPLLLYPPTGPARIAGQWDPEAGGYRCSVCPAVNTSAAVAERHAEVAHGVERLPEDQVPVKAADRKTTTSMTMPAAAFPPRAPLVDPDSQSSDANTLFGSRPRSPGN